MKIFSDKVCVIRDIWIWVIQQVWRTSRSSTAQRRSSDQGGQANDHQSTEVSLTPSSIWILTLMLMFQTFLSFFVMRPFISYCFFTDWSFYFHLELDNVSSVSGNILEPIQKTTNNHLVLFILSTFSNLLLLSLHQLPDIMFSIQVWNHNTAGWAVDVAVVLVTVLNHMKSIKV